MNRPFVIRLLITALLLLVHSAPTLSIAAPRPFANLPQANTDIAITEVFYRGGTGEDWVEIVNLGSENIDISSWWFCSKFEYGQLSTMTILKGDDLILLPGEVVVVQAWRDLNDVIADLGLYSNADFNSSSAMVDYVQWGTDANPGRANVAVSKGIWRESLPGQYDFVPTSGVTESAQWSGVNSGGDLLTLGSDWSNAAPTQGVFEKPTFRIYLPLVEKG